MAITIQRYEGPYVFIASRICLSLEEAQACEAALRTVPSPDAFQPASAPELPPAVEALQERHMADDPQVGGLKAGEAA
jgi:hypothetical protein